VLGIRIGEICSSMNHADVKMRDLEKHSPRFNSVRRLTSETSSYVSTVDTEEEIEDQDVAVLGVIDLEEDTFALTIAQLVRVFHALALGEVSTGILISRFVVTFGLLFLTYFLQIFLLIQIKRFVSAAAVHDIRIAYETYEIAMYGNNTERMIVTDTGQHRGLPQYFNESVFDTLPFVLQEDICNFPLSQPYFCGALLFLWTTACVAELKKTQQRVICLIINTETSDTMLHCFDGDSLGFDLKKDEKVIQRMTRFVKLLFIIFLFIPRVCITLFLLWLGCRWLLATHQFTDLILNGMALEFILLLKDSLYMGMVPLRYRSDLSNTKMLPRYSRLPASYSQLVEVLSWTFAKLAWVILYMTKFQIVLPQYNWDIHDTCLDWIAERYAV